MSMQLLTLLFETLFNSQRNERISNKLIKINELSIKKFGYKIEDVIDDGCYKIEVVLTPMTHKTICTFVES